ncbi:hypothetical protein BIW11_07637 [Tropilaelaps mercedesae]|uniref:Uncharacterized protein n=1 Tax=Tropilaelaps mercedesae TaxID=418985 RepID=A0A1V9XT46_9ACAR|nr:hypothetical protein BIW11_07637 [Tropilaelaps mercedesae]
MCNYSCKFILYTY